MESKAAQDVKSSVCFVTLHINGNFQISDRDPIQLKIVILSSLGWTLLVLFSYESIYTIFTSSEKQYGEPIRLHNWDHKKGARSTGWYYHRDRQSVHRLILQSHAHPGRTPNFKESHHVNGSGVLTVWLFNMNWTALSFTSFLTLLYVNKWEVKEKAQLQELKLLFSTANSF